MADGMTLRKAFFDADGTHFIPRPPCRSPWNPKHQNGVAVAGLLMHLAETVETPVPMLAAHVTIDILRGVPHAPLKGRAEVVRAGGKMQMVESFLVAEGEPVARARVMRVREHETPSYPEPMIYPQVDTIPERPFINLERVFGDLIESRVVAGLDGERGPGTVWVRFPPDVVAGVPASPTVCAGMLSDFGNGVSSPLARDRWFYANIDISLHLARRPVGEWLLVDASTMALGQGVGLANMILADRGGPFGRAHQTLFVAPQG